MKLLASLSLFASLAFVSGCAVNLKYRVCSMITAAMIRNNQVNIFLVIMLQY